MLAGSHMNAIDSNILIRYLTQDDVKQGEVAKNLVENGKPVFVTHIVFIESVWVLTTSYSLDRTTIAKALEQVTNNDFFVVEKNQLVSRALLDYQQGYDFADMLIGYCGKANDCGTTYTFDKSASKHSSFTLLAKI